MGIRVFVQIAETYVPHAIEKQEIHLLSRFRVGQLGLRRTNFLPPRNGLADGAIDDQYESGAGGQNRTADLRFTKPLLYRLSYAGGNENAHPASPAFPPDPRVSI